MVYNLNFQQTEKNIIERDVYEKYISNYYDDRHVESYNLEFIFLSNSALMNWNILPLSLSGQDIWTQMLIRNRQNKK